MALENTLEIVLSNLEALEAEFYGVKRAPVQYTEVLPPGAIDISINPGATIASYGAIDYSGKGSFQGSQAGDIGTVAVARKKVTTPLAAAAVGGSISTEDIRQHQFAYGGIGLNTEIMKAMRMAGERHIEGVFFYGFAELGFDGWVSMTGVTVDTAPNGAAGTPAWSTKTPDEILLDVNTEMIDVWSDTLQVHLPNALFLPTEQYGDLATRRIGNTSVSILTYLMENNIATLRTGQPLIIKAIHHLDGAGAAGVDRAVFAEMEPENIKFAVPLPFNLLTPQERGLQVDLFAEYKFGPPSMRYPASYRYLDSI